MDQTSFFETGQSRPAGQATSRANHALTDSIHLSFQVSVMVRQAGSQHQTSTRWLSQPAAQAARTVHANRLPSPYPSVLTRERDSFRPRPLSNDKTPASHVDFHGSRSSTQSRSYSHSITASAYRFPNLATPCWLSLHQAPFPTHDRLEVRLPFRRAVLSYLLYSAHPRSARGALRS